MKRLSAVLCAALLVITTCGCPIFIGCAREQTIEITVKVATTNSINSITNPEIKNIKTLLERAADDFVSQYDKDVKINVVTYEAGEEKRALIDTFGTSNAADMLYGGFFNMRTFIHTGNAVPLDDVLPAASKEDLQSVYYDGGCYNGKLYMLPYIASQNVFIYRKDWLKAYGLENYIPADRNTIATWNMDEWTHILDTLASNLADGQVPMMMYAKDNQGDTHIMTMLRAFGGEMFTGESDSELRFNLKDDPKIIEAFEWLQNGVLNDWYMPVAYYKTITDNNSKFETGELWTYIFNLGGMLAVDYKDTDKYGFANYPGGTCTFFSEGFEIFDNGNKQKINIAKDFLRYIYTTDKWLECSAGNIPVSKKVTEKYKDDIFLLDAFNTNAANGVDFTRNLPNWQGVRDVFYKGIAKLLMQNPDKTFTYKVEDIAAELEEKLNEAIDKGRAESHPHL